jgi:septum formation protein
VTTRHGGGGRTALVLASASPRRRELLAALGVDFSVEPADIDERARPGEPADVYVQRLAAAKAAAVAARHAADAVPPCVLAADTVVAVDGVLLGKPLDAADADRMLSLLSGRSHDVFTAVAVRRGTRVAGALSHSRVTFRAIGAAERAAYIASGEPLDKAGAYGIQGQGGIFAEHVAGSRSGVVGLPVGQVRALLSAFGIEIRRPSAGTPAVPPQGP